MHKTHLTGIFEIVLFLANRNCQAELVGPKMMHRQSLHCLIEPQQFLLYHLAEGLH